MANVLENIIGKGKQVLTENINEAKIKKGLAAGWSKLGSNGQFIWNWTGMHAAWCAMFVCWVVYQGFGSDWTKFIPKSYMATIPKQIVQNKGGSWVMKPGTKTPLTTPQPGDIWAERNYGHTGLVYSVNKSKGTITTIEGNWSKKVSTKTKPYSYFTCIARPNWGEVSGTLSSAVSSAGSAITGDNGEDDGRGLYFPEAISKLYSSNNYEFLYEGKSQDGRKLDFNTDLVKAYKKALKDINRLNSSTGQSRPSTGIGSSSGSLTGHSRNNITGAISDSAMSGILRRFDYHSRIDSGSITLNGIPQKSEVIKTATGKSAVVKGKFSIANSFVEAPTIILKLGDVVIGGYGNTGDTYPNYIESMTVEKVSGKINTYTINLIYQVRFNEDPNLIDKLLSRSGYTKYINIQYGDSNGAGLYKDEQMLITDASFSESVGSKQIKYKITAVSSIMNGLSMLSSYPAITDKPSNIIRNLLYSSNETSKALLTALPGMQNKTLVESNGLIPTDDAVVKTQKMSDVSTWNALNYYVSGMYGEADNASYSLSLHDDINNEYGGAYLKINKISPAINKAENANYFDIIVGYPDDNFVMDFTINTDVYFPLVYQYNGNLSQWMYDINNSGDLIRTKANPLVLNNNIKRKNVIQSNWWNKVTEYPITANLTLKGLSRPILIGSYVRINTVFYGNKDLGSGLYMVMSQTDSVSGAGCRTTLSLLRVGS